MMRAIGICCMVLGLFVVTLFAGVDATAGRDSLKELGENCFIVEQRCDDIIRTTEWGFELSGMKFGQAEKGSLVRLDPEVVEHVRNVAVLLDTLQEAYCKKVQKLSECLPFRDKHFANLYSCQQALQQLIIIGQCYSEKRMRLKFESMKWVVRSSFLLERLEARKLLPKKVDGENLKNQIAAAVDFALKDMEITPDSDKYAKFMRDPFLTRITENIEKK